MEVKFKFEIGAAVKINQNQRAGEVVGNWQDQGDVKKVNVRYPDANGLLAHVWLLEDEVTAA